MTPTYTATKLCARCKRVLPLDAFGLVRDDRAWRKSKCRDCLAKIERDRRREARS